MTDRSEVPRALFVGGCPGDTRRYRVFNQAEALSLGGWSVQVRTIESRFDLRTLNTPNVVILHRVQWDESVGQLLDWARGVGATVLFDTDDLVFQPELAPEIGVHLDLGDHGTSRFAEKAKRNRKTLQECDGCLVPTDRLASEVERIGLPAAVSRNAIDLETLRLSSQALRATGHEREQVVVGYASGTPSHDRDFLVVEEALRSVMSANPLVQLHIVGYLTLSREWETFHDRVTHTDYVTWRRLPAALAAFDINLAPLVVGDTFCESKSELKYVEAGAVALATIASPTGAFSHAIDDGETGVLATTSTEWTEALERMIADPDWRRQLGRRSRGHVLDQYTADVRSDDLAAALGRLGVAHAACTGWPLPVAAIDVAALASTTETKLDVMMQRDLGGQNAGTESAGRGAGSAGTDTESAGRGAGSAGTSADNTIVLYTEYEPYVHAMGPDRIAAQLECSARRGALALGPWLAARVAEADGCRTAAIGYPLDVSVYFPCDSTGETSPTVVYDASTVARAGGDDLGIRTLTLLREWLPKLHIVMLNMPVGGWQPEFAFENVGSPSPIDMARMYRKAGALLAPTFTNVSRQIVEAMACGCPVVAVDVPSVRWLLHDGTTAALAPPTAEALAAQLLRVLSAEDVRARIRAGGLAAVELMSIGRVKRDTSRGLMLLHGSDEPRGDWFEHTDPRGTVLDTLQSVIDPQGIPLFDGETIGQTFVARFDGLFRIDIMLERPVGAQSAPVIARLRRSESASDVVAESAVAATDLVDGSWTAFCFDAISASAGCRYNVAFECPGADRGAGPLVSVCRSDVFASGRTYVNGQRAPLSLAFRTFARPAVRVEDVRPEAELAIDPVFARLTTLGVDVRAQQDALRREHATLPYRSLQAAVRAARRLVRPR